jgi:cytochrome d ubiquinol oxidase subunit II
VGAIHLWIARRDAERRLVVRSIGPVWDGNEVWLLAAGGTLYFAFPALYASSFSGFYLPLMVVLWLLILRGAALEFRGHVDSPLWTWFWDVVFGGSSLLLAVFYGAALGNVVRGVPLDAEGRFFEPLWTTLTPGPHPGILDWYTILVAISALAALALHGALWLAVKTIGGFEERARRLAGRLWWTVLGLVIIITAASFHLQPHLLENFAAHAWGSVFPLIALAGLLGVKRFLGRRGDKGAFFSSSAFLVGMLASVAFGLHPYLLPASTDPRYGLTVEMAKTSAYGLRVGLIWWVVGMALATAYTVLAYRHFAGRLSPSESSDRY